MLALHRTLSVLFVAGISHVSAVCAADLTHKCDNDACAIQLKGEIESGDAEKFSILIEELKNTGIPVDRLLLLSKGGLVSEAIEIGKIVRDLAIFTYAPKSNRYSPPYPEGLIPGSQAAKDAVLENQNKSFNYFLITTLDGKLVTSSSKAVKIMATSGKIFEHDSDAMCASACALIAVSGLIRFGTVGLHHMSVDSENIEYDDLDNILTQSTDDVTSFLNEMRVPQSFLEDIFSTPSREMKWVDLYEVGSMDPILQEYADKKCGGLTDEQRDDELNLSLLAEHGSYFDMATMQVVERTITNAERRYLDELTLTSKTSSKCRNKLYSDAQRKAQGLE